MRERRVGIGDNLLMVLGVLLVPYHLMAVLFILGLGFAFLFWLMGDVTGTGGGRVFLWRFGEILWPWPIPGNGLPSVFISAAYWTTFIWWRRTPRYVPLWLKDLGGYLLGGVYAASRRMLRSRRKGMEEDDVQRRRLDAWDIGWIVLGLLLWRYVILGPVYIVAMPFALLIEIFSDVDFPWGDALLTVLVFGGYMTVILWRRYPDRVPLWAKDLAGRAFSDTEVAVMDSYRNRGKDSRPTPGDVGPGTSGSSLARWEGAATPNDALERLMNDLLANQPRQGWLADMAMSLRDQARAGRLQGNMERIVAILEQEKKRLQHLTEINKLSGQLSQAGVMADVEAKRVALERLKVEHEAQGLAMEMSDLLGLKEVKVKERQLREKEIELRMTRMERELEELRRKPEPIEPHAQETAEDFATRRADLLIRYAGEVKRIRGSVDDPELAEDLVDRFLSDIAQRERP